MRPCRIGVSAISKIILLLLLAMLSSATAGGVSWRFRVVDFRQEGNGESVIVLRPVQSGIDFPLNCETLTVHAKYNTWKWLFVGDKDISKGNHKAALLLLKERFANKSTVYFGPIGEGFGFEGATPSCVVSSKALSIVDTGGEKEIFSYFKWP